MFRFFDSDEDGYIDFKEFWIALYVITNGTKEEKLQKVQ